MRATRNWTVASYGDDDADDKDKDDGDDDDDDVNDGGHSTSLSVTLSPFLSL